MANRTKSAKGHELDEAAELGVGGKRVAYSGAGEFKSDIEYQVSLRDWWMIECKETGLFDVLIKREWWEKLEQEAMIEHKTPAINLRGREFNVYIIESGMWLDLFKRSSYRPILKSIVVASSTKVLHFTLPEMVGFVRMAITVLEPILVLQCWDRELVLIRREFFHRLLRGDDGI